MYVVSFLFSFLLNLDQGWFQGKRIYHFSWLSYCSPGSWKFQIFQDLCPKCTEPKLPKGTQVFPSFQRLYTPCKSTQAAVRGMHADMQWCSCESPTQPLRTEPSIGLRPADPRPLPCSSCGWSPDRGRRATRTWCWSAPCTPPRTPPGRPAARTWPAGASPVW